LIGFPFIQYLDEHKEMVMGGGGRPGVVEEREKLEGRPFVLRRAFMDDSIIASALEASVTPSLSTG